MNESLCEVAMGYILEEVHDVAHHAEVPPRGALYDRYEAFCRCIGVLPREPSVPTPNGDTGNDIMHRRFFGLEWDPQIVRDGKRLRLVLFYENAFCEFLDDNFPPGAGLH